MFVLPADVTATWKGIGALVEGQDARDVINRLEGTTCGFKSTSCPDQLAKALKEALNQ